MEILLTVLVTWLAANFDLPSVHEHPRIEFVQPARMAELRYSRLAAAQPGGEAEHRPASATGEAVFAIYDDASRTIFLPKNWTAATPAEMSVLVHELVHHLQNAGGQAYDCAGAREKPAYRAQARWLELFGKTLADEFALDPMTLLVRTNCFR